MLTACRMLILRTIVHCHSDARGILVPVAMVRFTAPSLRLQLRPPTLAIYEFAITRRETHSG